MRHLPRIGVHPMESNVAMNTLLDVHRQLSAQVRRVPLRWIALLMMAAIMLGTGMNHGRTKSSYVRAINDKTIPAAQASCPGAYEHCNGNVQHGQCTTGPDLCEGCTPHPTGGCLHCYCG